MSVLLTLTEQVSSTFRPCSVAVNKTISRGSGGDPAELGELIFSFSGVKPSSEGVIELGHCYLGAHTPLRQMTNSNGQVGERERETETENESSRKGGEQSFQVGRRGAEMVAELGGVAWCRIVGLGWRSKPIDHRCR